MFKGRLFPQWFALSPPGGGGALPWGAIFPFFQGLCLFLCRWSLPMAMSICHRGTGMALSAGTYVCAHACARTLP